jgi:hypothetical protein
MVCVVSRGLLPTATNLINGKGCRTMNIIYVVEFHLTPTRTHFTQEKMVLFEQVGAGAIFHFPSIFSVCELV